MATATNPSAAFTILQNAGLPVVTVGSPAKVNFTVLDNGAVVKGLTSANVSFALAKLVKGTGSAPDQWKSYVYRTELATAGVGPGGTPALASATQPTTDTKSDAQLVYNSQGYYTYTFSTDITDPTKTNGVAYEPGLTHRIAIQLSYTDSAGATVRVNPTFDFTLVNGQSVPVTDSSLTRKVVDTSSCNGCHDTLALHGGGRIDTQYCVLCHNPDNTDANSGNVLDLGRMAHKIHAGKLVKTWFNQDYTIWGYRDGQHDYNEVGFPQDVRNCTKCHDNTKAAQADNWKNVPSRAACGACHAGLNFETGGGQTIAGAKGDTTAYAGHVGGVQKDDSKCALCHNADNIPLYHLSVVPPDTTDARFTGGTNTHTNSEWINANWDSLPAGAIKVSWEISSVSRNASQQPVIVFRGLRNGTAAPFNDPATKTEIWNNFIGSPNLYFVWAEPQDGIDAPADFNKSASTWLKTLWNGTATGTKAGTLTGPDTNGYYTATLTGVTVPDTAVMLTGGVGFTYGSGSPPLTQINLADYPVAASTAIAGTYTGGLAVPAPNVTKVATGYTGRRAIVENAKCNNCHETLGVFTEHAFHAGQRNDGTTCAWCHTPNRASSGWSADAEYFVHAIHGAGKRSQNFTWHAASATEGFFNVAYPGILKNCETCHVPGSYDFGATANKDALPNRLYRSAASGIFTAGDTTPPEGYQGLTTGVDYGTSGAGTNLVLSPIAGACASCHDGPGSSGVDPIQHMRQNGGSFYADRTSALAAIESCALCHGSGRMADIKAVHAR